MHKLHLFFLPLLFSTSLFSTFLDELEPWHYNPTHFCLAFLNTLTNGNKERGAEILIATKNCFGKETVKDNLYHALVVFERYCYHEETYLAMLLAHHPFQHYLNKNKKNIKKHFPTLLTLALQRKCSHETIAKLDALLSLPSSDATPCSMPS